MNINSEQEMFDFGANYAKDLYMQTISANDTLEEDSLKKSSFLKEKNTTKPTEAVVIELIGDVGAGKTTFVRGLAKGLGIKSPITSPSFTISKSYALPNNKGHLIHYDFYRLSDPGLMIEDLTENLQNPSNIIVIEWGKSIVDFLPDDRITIRINYSENNTREVTISAH